MKINRNRYSHNFKSTIFIDFQYQSINCYWLLLIIIDFIDDRKPLIDNAGCHIKMLYSVTLKGKWFLSVKHLTLAFNRNTMITFNGRDMNLIYL